MVKLISVQINGQANCESNLSKIEAIIEQACREVSANFDDEHRLVVLPECFSIFGVAGSKMIEYAEREGDGYIQNRVAEIAKKFRCYIVAGTTPIVNAFEMPDAVAEKRADNTMLTASHPPPRNTKYYAASLVFSPSGKCIARYNKIHMFDVEVEDATQSYKESLHTEAGEYLSLFKTPFAEVAQSVCYDLRFPEMFSAYSRFTQTQQSPDIIVVPSAFTRKTGSAHWHALLKARSIENQCYVVASNQVGTHADKRETFGNSCIYSPWGECLSVIDDEEGYAIATYNKAEIDNVRANMPIGAHKQKRYTLSR